MMNEILDVVVRFHDPRRIGELERCFFSLVGQAYRPLNVIVVTQRFGEADINRTREALGPLLKIEGAPTLSFANWAEAEPPDARSLLINAGISAGKGRYLAFLDYDDILYPEAYTLLVSRLRGSDAGIAFGRICAKRLTVHQYFMRAETRSYPYKGSSVLDLFRTNFCPIHSFVVDRSKVPPHIMHFDAGLARMEDYDFLMRVCAQVPADFALTSTTIGDYLFKDDGSNTTITSSSQSPLEAAAWKAGGAFIEARRRTLPVSVAVQADLGISPPIPGLTVKQLLEQQAAR